MSSAGIGTPYWYEWEIGIIECLKMMTDSSIDSVTLQSGDFQSLDDVVVKYTDGSIINIQVKHTDIDKNMTYSSLEPADMLRGWAKEWVKEKENHIIRKIYIVTNRKWGPNATEGKCSFSDFITKVLPKLKENPVYLGKDDLEQAAIEWYKKTIALPNNDTIDFIGVLEFKNETDLSGLNSSIRYLLKDILGTDKEEVINTGIDRLRSKLETWVTSRRVKPEITREDLYTVLCDPSQVIPEFELYPNKPIFPSREKFAKSFINNIQSSDKKIIFFQGSPGSGKTNFISYLAQLKDSIVDFRYYTYLPVNIDSPVFSDDTGYYNGKTLWCSILYQLKKKFEELKILSNLKFPLIYDYLSITKLREYALKYLTIYVKKSGRPCYLFIDGMDHVARSNDIRNTFLSQLPQADEIGEGVKFILVGQPINDKYPNWLINNKSIDYCELPPLEEEDIKTLIKSEKIEIENVDFDTLATAIISVAGNNTLNVLFAILEIKRMSSPLNFDDIISYLKKRCLNGLINRYYDWIISSIETSLNLYQLEAIFAFSSRKIPSTDLAKLCNKSVI